VSEQGQGNKWVIGKSAFRSRI